MHTLKTGDLAYYDSFAGLLPCKVTAISGTSGQASTSQRITFKLTSSAKERNGYRKGEVMEASALHVVPRGAVSFRKYNAMIGPYTVEV